LTPIADVQRLGAHLRGPAAAEPWSKQILTPSRHYAAPLGRFNCSTLLGGADYRSGIRPHV
jgi:hypothetical protein